MKNSKERAILERRATIGAKCGDPNCCVRRRYNDAIDVIVQHGDIDHKKNNKPA